jgi:hypothetical protein
MIVTTFTPEQYALLEMLENPQLVPSKDDEQPATGEDPRIRVLEAQLPNLASDFDESHAVLLAQMADELVARNKARIEYANKASARAKAGHEAANVLVDYVTAAMRANDIDHASGDGVDLQMHMNEPTPAWSIVDIKALPEEYWKVNETRTVNFNKIEMHFIDQGDPIPGVEQFERPARKYLRKR